MAFSSSEPRNEPRAIPILKFCGNSVDLDADAVTSIFCNPKIQDKPLCIVSMSGAFRKGKSFMLNFFIRYLRNRGYENPDWMGKDDVFLNEGFEWRGGRRACTKGIQVWSEVFTAKKNREEVAILLMDTQGLFDNKSDNKTNSIIFALSTLISSVQIFNLSQQIQESDLGFLQFFTSYSHEARKASYTLDLKPFQNLLFLVRDWPYAESIEYGMEGGKAYLADVLSDESTSEELSSVRRFLTSSFESTKCCLMPHPGLKVATTSNDFTGYLRDMENDFLIHTTRFADNLFQPRNLVLKIINGQVISAVTMLQYTVDCGACMTDGKLPNPRTMMENVAEAQNFEAQKRCGEKYRQNMLEILGNSFVDYAFFRENHDQESKSALKKFSDMTRFGSKESRMKHRDHLQSVIDREYGMLAQINRCRKVEAEAELLRVIEEIAKEYEKSLKASTKESDFLSESELQNIHETFAGEAFKKYGATKDANPQLHDKYSQWFQRMIDRIQKGVKAENEEKRRVAEEQEKMKKKNVLKLELDCAIQYKERMRKLNEHYTEETRFGHSNEGERKTIIDQFQMDAFDIGASQGSKTWNDHLTLLNSKLDKEFKRICQINKEKKVNLEKNLESQSNKSIVTYDETFRWLLKDNYLEKVVLKQMHDEVVQNLMEAMRSSYKVNDQRIPIVAQYLEEVENTLNSKYSVIEKWNEKNNTFLRKCFKAVRSAVPPIIIIGAKESKSYAGRVLS